MQINQLPIFQVFVLEDEARRKYNDPCSSAEDKAKWLTIIRECDKRTTPYMQAQKANGKVFSYGDREASHSQLDSSPIGDPRWDTSRWV